MTKNVYLNYCYDLAIVFLQFQQNIDQRNEVNLFKNPQNKFAVDLILGLNRDSLYQKEQIKMQKSEQNLTPKSFQQKSQLTKSQLNHLINVIRQRYISPYKIIYMINQQQADLFKWRNQDSGCCSSSAITIPKHQMTKTEIFLSEAINKCLKINNLNKILQQISDKFDNIVKSGQKQNLKVDNQVEKFLVEKSLSQSFNLYIYKTVIERLKKQNESFSNSAMLWATPNTWYARFPKTQLNFLSSQTLSNLDNQHEGCGFQQDFLSEYKDDLFKELRLLQQDGKFQQLIWKKNNQTVRNDIKTMNFPENYSFDGTQSTYTAGQIIYPNLKKSLLTLRSIPFQLNQKMNAYCTISQNNQISYFKDTLCYKVRVNQKCKFLTFCVIGGQIKCKIQNKTTKNTKQKYIKEGELVTVSTQFCDIELVGEGKQLFLFKSWIFTLAKKQ